MSKGPRRHGFARRPVVRPDPKGINWVVVVIVLLVLAMLIFLAWPMVSGAVGDFTTPRINLSQPTPFTLPKVGA